MENITKLTVFIHYFLFVPDSHRKYITQLTLWAMFALQAEPQPHL